MFAFSLSKLQLIATAIMVGLLVVAGVTYHYSVVRGLETQLTKAEKEVQQLTREKNELLVRNMALTTENTNFKDAVTNQNAKLEELQSSIAKHTEDAKTALKLAEIKAKRWEGEYKPILNVQPVENDGACKAWDQSLTQYLAVRQKELAP